MAKKAAVKAIKVARVWGDSQWTVRFGKLNPGPGRPEVVLSLFRVVGEKIPLEALHAVNSHLKKEGIGRNGVYVAHDSMGYALHWPWEDFFEAALALEGSNSRTEVFLILRCRRKET